MTGAHGYAASSGAVRIATGALLPVGFDTVLPFEEVAETPGRIEVPRRRPRAATCAGRERTIGRGTWRWKPGGASAPPHVLLLANLGCAEVEVVRRPRVAVLATGSEVVEDLSAPLRPGQVRNSNARYLMSALAASGCKPRSAGTVPDREDAVRTALQQMLEGDPPVDLILTIGGVSRGAADFVPAALAALGADYLFRGVALRPVSRCCVRASPAGVR